MTVGLRHAPLLYVFLDIAGLDDERALLEDIAGLPVIEIEKHQPHERHGVVKYDAGPLILSLNLSTPAKFRDDVSDGLVTVMDVDADSPAFQRLGPRLTDPWGHHFELRSRAVAAGPPTVAELRLVVADLDASLAFYGDRLGLELLEAGARGARLATGSADLVLRAAETAVDGRRADHRTVLIVFHAAGIEDVREGLVERGVVFDNRRVAYSKIGGTTRFTDPSGHRFCLYEPSADSLGWGSGPKVIEVAALGAAAS